MTLVWGSGINNQKMWMTIKRMWLGVRGRTHAKAPKPEKTSCVMILLDNNMHEVGTGPRNAGRKRVIEDICDRLRYSACARSVGSGSLQRFLGKKDMYELCF